MAIEEPKYAVYLHEGAYEIRDYPAAVAAEVTVTGDQHGAARKGFRLLARYIFGGNTRRQSIAMTAPVAVERTSEQIAMTAPVTRTPSDGAWVGRFTMPDENNQRRNEHSGHNAVIRNRGAPSHARSDIPSPFGA